MASDPTKIPRDSQGNYDREAVGHAFMASPYLDWTRFCEEQGWDPHYTRRQFPVRSWQKEKRDKLAESQGDVIAGLIHERRFKWTRDILDTLDRYPHLIDVGSKLAEAKMHTLSEMYQEYLIWKKEGKHIVKAKNGNEKRVYHPWEKVSLSEIHFMLKGLKEITDAKMKALMLDKWAMKRMDIPDAEMNPPDESGENKRASITIEGKKDITFEDMQSWFDQFADKPVEDIEDLQPKQEAPQESAPGMLDDNGRPI